MDREAGEKPARTRRCDRARNPPHATRQPLATTGREGATGRLGSQETSLRSVTSNALAERGKGMRALIAALSVTLSLVALSASGPAMPPIRGTMGCSTALSGSCRTASSKTVASRGPANPARAPAPGWRWLTPIRRPAGASEGVAQAIAPAGRGADVVGEGGELIEGDPADAVSIQVDPDSSPQNNPQASGGRTTFRARSAGDWVRNSGGDQNRLSSNASRQQRLDLDRQGLQPLSVEPEPHFARARPREPEALEVDHAAHREGTRYHRGGRQGEGFVPVRHDFAVRADHLQREPVLATQLSRVEEQGHEDAQRRC